jgi:hypothetical protein
MSWTNERIELLQKLRLDGWSASRIAGELAHGITRNAVIGKVYRLGLSGRAKALPSNVPASPPHHKAPRRAAHRHANSPQVVGNTALALRTFTMSSPARRDKAKETAVEDSGAARVRVIADDVKEPRPRATAVPRARVRHF